MLFFLRHVYKSYLNVQTELKPKSRLNLMPVCETRDGSVPCSSDSTVPAVSGGARLGGDTDTHTRRPTETAPGTF